jgi:hypothetical protein
MGSRREARMSFRIFAQQVALISGGPASCGRKTKGKP